MRKAWRSTRVAVASLAMLAGAAAIARAEDAPPAPSPTDAELERLAAQGEVVEIWDERPEKPFDRDTEIRLSGEELAQRGATDLGTALALLPDVTVRDAGRGGYNIDIRGGRKGAVRVLIDGVAVSDPYYGTFDVSSIPITDIVQIRVSTAPASPIDGPGGPGGVIEVHTRDATGARLVVARLTGDSLPIFGASATGRAELASKLAARVSASSVYGAQHFDTAMAGVTVDDRRKANTGAMRLEYRDGARRVALDGFVDHRSYVSPPSDELAQALILAIDGETTGRAILSYDDDVGDDHKLQVQARGWVHAMSRQSRSYSDAALTAQVNREDLFSMRTGAMALATRPIGSTARWVASLTVDHEHARDEIASANATQLVHGDVTVIEAAGDGQVERGPWKLDGSAGLAIPIGLDGATPWPEAKLSARYHAELLDVEAIGARKGRVPTLRERFQGTFANQALSPEMASHGELRVTAHPRDGVQIVVAPYYHRTTGTVRLDPNGSNLLVNLGELHVYGVDTSARAQLVSWAELGGGYDYAIADSADFGKDPLDRFPHHRAEGWVRAMPTSTISALARARYNGRSIDQNATTPAYVLWDLTLSAAIGGDWLAVARCDDLLDVRPETRNGYHSPGRVLSLAVQGTWQ